MDKKASTATARAAYTSDRSDFMRQRPTVQPTAQPTAQPIARLPTMLNRPSIASDQAPN